MGFASALADGLGSFAYANFLWLGKPLLRVMKWLPSSLHKAGLRVYPEAYMATVAFVTILSVPLSIALFFSGILRGPLSYVLLAIPVLVFLVVLGVPIAQASAKASILDVEVPYAAAYLSILSMGGVSPYKGLQRLKRSGLLPNISKAAAFAEVDVRVRGIDPVTAMEESAKRVPSKDYGDLVSGYVTTLRTGGDTRHYVVTKTDDIFNKRAERIRAGADRLATLMEMFVGTTTIMFLGVYLMLIVGKTLPRQFRFEALSDPQFFILVFFVMPFLTFFFIYLFDLYQPHYPFSEKRPYGMFYAILPLGAILVLSMFLSSVLAPFRYVVAPFSFLSSLILSVFRLERGFDTTIQLSVILIVTFLPAAIYDIMLSRKEQSMVEGMTRFIRELVETRKTGLSPERSIESLSKKDYAGFTKYLRGIAAQISWGVSLERIFRVFTSKVRSWTAAVTMFLMVDSIDVGGGGTGTLEQLARFNEKLESVDRERKSALRPLTAMSYVGSLVLLLSAAFLMGFVKSSLRQTGVALDFNQLLRFFMLPVVVNVAIMALTSGKVSSDRVSAGFKHVVLVLILVIASLPMYQLLSGVLFGG